jgi:hypothetical protein
MSACDCLHPIETALHAAHGSLGVVTDDALDISEIHLLREITVTRFPDAGGREDRALMRAKNGRSPAKVRDLAHNSGTMAVDTRRKILQMRHDPVARQVQFTTTPA